MLTFLRRIRKALLDSGNAGKYMVYAIGEIVLVVIGILIALQINNWNEERKTFSSETKYLQRFLLDLESDTIYLTKRIQESSSVFHNNKRFVQQAFQRQESLEDFRQLITSVAWPVNQLVLQNSTYLELSNAGQLDIFSSTELKELIIAYYRDYELFRVENNEYIISSVLAN